MLNLRWRFLRALHRHALLQRHVIAFSSPDVHLDTRESIHRHDPRVVIAGRKYQIQSIDRQGNGQIHNTHLSGAPNLHAAFLQHHLPPMCQPSDHSGDNEQDREEVKRETCKSARIAPLVCTLGHCTRAREIYP